MGSAQAGASVSVPVARRFPDADYSLAAGDIETLLSKPYLGKLLEHMGIEATLELRLLMVLTHQVGQQAVHDEQKR